MHSTYQIDASSQCCSPVVAFAASGLVRYSIRAGIFVLKILDREIICALGTFAEIVDVVDAHQLVATFTSGTWTRPQPPQRFFDTRICKSWP